MSDQAYLKEAHLPFTWVVFATLSLPSLKLIYSSPLLNVGLMALYGFFLLHFYVSSPTPVFLGIRQRIFLFLFICLMLLVFISYFVFPFSYFSFDKLVKYAFIFIAALTTATFVERVHIRLLVNLLIAWGLILCVWKLTIGISLNFEKGQTYLTYGMPIGCSLMLLLIRVFEKLSSTQILVLLAFIGLNIFVILTSRGRSSIIFPFLSFGVVLTAALFSIRNRKVAAKVLLAGGVFFLAVGSYVLANLETFKSLARVIALVESGGEDNRLDLWLPAVEAISRNPFGYGTDAHEYILIHYPHNIFLEIGLAYGIIGVLLFLGILFLTAQRFRENIRKNVYYISISAIGLYFLLSWNTSHDFATATIPFVAFALALKA
ncbi:MAG: O-antigen ligase family protein [Lunatimonas sp.]|uniref:O-antigen ligase family protein n=1 Tax=Lunatimonas sp. TaxID=2060141 RepID=UPI00263B5F5D|nr:O-antigen ligase family protein [Lunatimonas sp.]MCC5937196.1 O-antigen ligase family protein [Lunatimonas sp.]